MQHNGTNFKSVGLEDSPEERPHVPPLVLMVQQDGLHLGLVILRLLVGRVLHVELQEGRMVRVHTVQGGHLGLAGGCSGESVTRIVVFYHFPRGLLRRDLQIFSNSEILFYTVSAATHANIFKMMT